MALPPVAQQFIIGTGTKDLNASNGELNRVPWTLSDNGIKSVLELVDPDVLYLDKLTRLLYSASLVKTGASDPKSPLSGYSLQMTMDEKNEHHPTISYEGYATIANNYILFVTHTHATTHLDTKKYNLEESAVMDTMSLMDMLCANWEAWHFENDTMIVSLGLAIFEGIYFTRRRSAEGNMLNKLVKILSGGSNPSMQEDGKPKVKWLPL